MLHKTIFYIIPLLIIASCKSKNSDTTYHYPHLDNKISTHTLFDSTITNQYENLEFFDKQPIKDWITKQDSLTSNYYKVNNYELYTKKLSELYDSETRTKYWYRPIDNNIFYFIEEIGDESIIKKINTSKESENTIKSFSPNEYLYLFEPSSNGEKIIAITLNQEASTLYIIDANTGNTLFKQTKDINVNVLAWAAWTNNDKSIAFTGFPNKDDSKDSYVGLINLQTLETKKIFSNENKEVSYNSEFFAIAAQSGASSEHFIIYVANASEHYDAYYTTNENIESNNITWKSLFTQKDSIQYYGTLKNNKFFFKHYQNGKKIISSADLNNIAKTKTILYEAPEGFNITEFAMSNTHTYISVNKNGLDSKLLKLNTKKQLDTVPMDYPIGEISFYNSNVENNPIYIATNNWTTNRSVFKFSDNDGLNKSSDISKATPDEFKDITYSVVNVKSNDGTKVPMTIIHKKDFKLNKKSKGIITAYGAYGTSKTPEYDTAILNFVNKGNFYAIAHVRGGGELGYQWYLDGIKEKKQNSWKDLVSCAKFLKENNYCHKDKLGLFFESAGGISGGMALIENPNLFNAVASAAPFFNPTRIESHENYNSTDRIYDFGTIKEKQGFYDLLKMDPIVNYQEDKNYPATLMMIGLKDDLVPFYSPAKYIALLQSKDSISTSPYLLDTYHQNGHNLPYDEMIGKAFYFLDSNL